MATGGASSQVTEEDATELQFPKGLLSYTLLEVTAKVLKKSNLLLSDRASFYLEKKKTTKNLGLSSILPFAITLILHVD